MAGTKRLQVESMVQMMGDSEMESMASSDSNTVICALLHCKLLPGLDVGYYIPMFIARHPLEIDAVENSILKFYDDDGSEVDEEGDALARAEINRLIDAVVNPFVKTDASIGVALDHSSLPFAFMLTLATVDGVVRVRVGSPQGIDESEFFPHFRTADEVLPPDATLYNPADIQIIDYSGDYGGTRNACIATAPDGSWMAMQSIPTIEMLLYHTRWPLDVFYREIEVLNAIPAHPNIVRPCGYIIRRIGSADFVCGILAEYYTGGNLEDIIDAQVVTPVLFSRKIKWAAQICSAIRHIHYVAHTYHGNLKLGNAVLDGQDDVKLIDFEQMRANSRGLAPEMRERTGYGWTYDDTPRHDWCGAYEWLKKDTAALERAEVYALGVTLSTLFGQDGVPQDVIELISACMQDEPQRRPTLEAVASFFQSHIDGC